MQTKKLVSLLVLSGLAITPTLLQNSPVYAGSLNMVGEWSGSPDCPIFFYLDDGQNVRGDCDNGSYDHNIIGRYVGEETISITLERIDPQKCKTSVQGYITKIGYNQVRMRQEGWNGCGVRTKPGSQVWTKVGS